MMIKNKKRMKRLKNENLNKNTHNDDKETNKWINVDEGQHNNSLNKDTTGLKQYAALSLLNNHPLHRWLKLKGPLLGQLGRGQEQLLQHTKSAIVVTRIRGQEVLCSAPCLEFPALLQDWHTFHHWEEEEGGQGRILEAVYWAVYGLASFPILPLSNDYSSKYQAFLLFLLFVFTLPQHIF